MSGTRALFVGLRRALFAPHLVVLLLVINAATALPAAWFMRDALHDSIGKRTASAAMLESFDSSWYDEWSDRQDGLTETFEPEISGALFKLIQDFFLARRLLPAIAIADFKMIFVLKRHNSFIDIGLNLLKNRPDFCGRFSIHIRPLIITFGTAIFIHSPIAPLF